MLLSLSYPIISFNMSSDATLFETDLPEKYLTPKINNTTFEWNRRGGKRRWVIIFNMSFDATLFETDLPEKDLTPTISNKTFEENL